MATPPRAREGNANDTVEYSCRDFTSSIGLTELFFWSASMLVINALRQMGCTAEHVPRVLLSQNSAGDRREKRVSTSWPPSSVSVALR